ncbi:branched-chain amino acid ABC transporter substrate-binding protein [Rhizobiaceae bacterium BDR2-2]|uniref:Branched-chain amino acid ABC transporter substrate-binding protein n=1 Tax=Ectorhizobium quercum TaxID=2965071 RepID=A0AAE3N3P5_9HYPH|nr:branched-chain amino acid ABC transporter substrate-binding protein [Ectorhizobium quercum]MCX8999372.1 branched-chain amino acid ABC transporter substrate-binding protein [Ectorhizobium quercum]
MSLGAVLRAGVACLSLAIAGAASAEPLKVALVETLSGPQASTGLLYRAAVLYQLGKINEAGGFNGEKIQLLEYDNQGGPVGAADRVKAAIADGAQVILQGSSSAVAGQITEDVRKFNLRNRGREVLYLNLGAEALELTGAKCHFYHFRFSPNAAIRFKTVALGMKEEGILGSRAYSINQNYSWGVDVENTVTANAGEIGYEVVEKTLHEVNKIQDFSPYVARIQAANVDTVFTGNWSNDLLLLMKAASGAGLKAKFATAFLDQPGNIGNAGAIAEGHVVSTPYNPEANGETSMAFAEDYRSVTGHYPAYVEPAAVFGLMLFGEALKDVASDGGKVDTTKIALALEAATVDTPMGEYSMRADDHQAQFPMVVQTVSREAKVKADGTEFGFLPVKSFSGADSIDPVQDSCSMQRPG